MSFFEWLLLWKPEHVIGLVTAASLVLAAFYAKGRAKRGAESVTPHISSGGTLRNARLHELDRLLIENVHRLSEDNKRSSELLHQKVDFIIARLGK